VNPTLRRGIPWAVALVLHAGVLFIPVRLGMIPRSRPEDRRIDLVFDQPAPRALPAAGRLPPRQVLELPPGAAPRVPSPAALPAPESEAVRPSAPLDDRLVDLAMQGSTPYPTPREVLADLPAPAAIPESTSAPAAAVQAVADVSTAPPTLKWQGAARGIIRRPSPEFPPFMSRVGQEGECVARITVNPAGTVTRVDIVQSSGYSQIDASIAAALRGWQFARAADRTDTATVTFLFRLERRD
jgi:protein TonB